VRQSFFDDVSELLECLSTFSTPLIIASEFIVLIDDTTDIQAVKLTDLLSCDSLR